MRNKDPAVRSRVPKALALALVLVTVALAWGYLAPTRLGGKAAYVTTFGSSMEPAFHAGDLALIRKSTTYDAGDVVAYRSRSLHVVVLHRIIAHAGSRYVLKGDNNDWVDSDEPSRADIIGKLAFRIPAAGRFLQWARTPFGLSTLIGSMMLILAVTATGLRRRSRRRGGSVNGSANGKHRAPARSSSSRTPGALPHRTLPVAAVVTMVFLAMGVFAYARPLMRDVLRDITYEQRGGFSYSAEVPGGEAVYGADGLSTGDPVYLKLAKRVLFTFRYQLDSPATVVASGTASLSAVIEDADGWSRTIEIRPSTTFSGPQTTISGIVDIGLIGRLTAEVQRLTGVERDSYTVAIVPDFHAHAGLNGHPVDLTFVPELTFRLDGLELQWMSSTGASIADSAHPVEGGLLQVPVSEPNTLSVFGFDLGVEHMRIFSVAGAAISLVALLIIALAARRARRAGETERIFARYGERLIAVRANGAQLETAIEVRAMDALAALAAHYGQPILHEEQQGTGNYFFREGGQTYRYRVREENGSAAKN
jgi:signal peptidase I